MVVSKSGCVQVNSSNSCDMGSNGIEKQLSSSQDDDDNYDITTLRSDSETDDEDNPKRTPAWWTQGPYWTQAIERQSKCPPDLDQIFAIQNTIELTEVFPGCSKLSKRTSGDRRTDWDEADAPRSHNHTEVTRIMVY